MDKRGKKHWGWKSGRMSGIGLGMDGSGRFDSIRNHPWMVGNVRSAVASTWQAGGWVSRRSSRSSSVRTPCLDHQSSDRLTAERAQHRHPALLSFFHPWLGRPRPVCIIVLYCMYNTAETVLVRFLFLFFSAFHSCLAARDESNPVGHTQCAVRLLR